jgi:hypothetical protein
MPICRVWPAESACECFFPLQIPQPPQLMIYAVVLPTHVDIVAEIELLVGSEIYRRSPANVHPHLC